MKEMLCKMIQSADPEKINWSNFVNSYTFYVGPNPDPNGHAFADDVNASHYTFEIAARTYDLSSWAVTYHGAVLDKKENDFVYEGFSSSRTKNFLKRCRFKSKEDAFKALQKWLDTYEAVGAGWKVKDAKKKI